MTREEWEIVDKANRIKEYHEWERRCKDCRWLGSSQWCDGVKAYRCKHPERQGGFNDPRPYGCKGTKYQR